MEKERDDKRRGLLTELLYLVVEVRTLERVLRSVDGENCLANDFSFSGPRGLESMTGLSNCSLRCMSSLRIVGVICRVVWRAGDNLNTVQT